MLWQAKSYADAIKSQEEQIEELLKKVSAEKTSIEEQNRNKSNKLYKQAKILFDEKIRYWRTRLSAKINTEKRLPELNDFGGSLDNAYEL